MAKPKRWVTFNCDVCWKECYLSQNQYNEQKQHCCSLKCRNELRWKEHLPWKKFWKLTILKWLWTNKNGCRELLCKCDCWNISIIGSHNRWKTKSCWCLWGKVTHWMYWTPEMNCRNAINWRCNNKNHKNYKDYWGRGIKVKFKNFEEFYKEIWPRPWLEYSVDRIDNNKWYEPWNVRWATVKEQCNNKRCNTICVINWESHNLKERADKLWIKYQTLKHRIRKWLMKWELYPYKPYKDDWLI